MSAKRNGVGALIFFGMIALFFLLGFSTGAAQDYPSKPINIVLGSTPGAAGGISAQIFAEGAKKYLPKSQPLLLNYKPGAAGAVAADYVLKQSPDGYNLLWIVQDLLVKLAKDGPQLSFKKEDLIPIGIIGASPPILTVNREKSPIEKFEDFISYAKKNPGKLSCGVVGIGSGTHLTGELLQAKCGINMNFIPYAGGAPIVAALLGGHVDCCVLTYGTQQAHLGPGGGLRPLLVLAPHRFQELPDVFTSLEKGYDIDRNNWYALAAPKGTPKIILDTLARVFKQTADDPDVKSMLIKAGYVPLNLGPEDTEKKFNFEYDFAREIFKKLGMLQ
jgi:tripartite-type tricarboxylate transporter receptor subunit TctC